MSEAKTLVKNGEWQVEEAERPANWKTMKIRERKEVTVSQTISETTSTEHTVEVEQVKEIDAPVESVMSFLPEDAPESMNLLNQAIGLFGRSLVRPNPNLDDENYDFDGEYYKLELLGDAIRDYQDAKAEVDSHLSAWVDRNKTQLRHLGVRSKAMQDLWTTVHAMVMRGLHRQRAYMKEQRDKI